MFNPIIFCCLLRKEADFWDGIMGWAQFMHLMEKKRSIAMKMRARSQSDSGKTENCWGVLGVGEVEGRHWAYTLTVNKTNSKQKVLN